MLAVEKKEDFTDSSMQEIRGISIVLSGTDRKYINKFSREFFEFSSKLDSTTKEPLILDTAEAIFTTRKSPCGNGTASFSRHTLRVHQRKFDLNLNDSSISKVLEFLKNSNLDAQIKMNS